MKILIYIIVLGFLAPVFAYSQEEKELIQEGNESYRSENYKEAEIKYRKSLEKNKNSKEANFNLGTSLYKQDQYGEAAEKFLDMTTKELDDYTLAKSHYNYGNAMLQNEKFEESIAAYKNALRLNPDDMDAKYNLEYAKKRLAKQQQDQQNQDKNQDKKNDQKKDQDKNKNDQDKEKQDQNKDQQNKDQQDKDQQDKKDQQDQQDKQQQNKDQQQDGQQAKPQDQKLTKQEADRLLNALSRKEKDLQKKLMKKEKSNRTQIEKNW